MARLRLSGSRFQAISYKINIKPTTSRSIFDKSYLILNNLNFLSDMIAVEAFSLGEMIIVHSTFFLDRK